MKPSVACLRLARSPRRLAVPRWTFAFSALATLAACDDPVGAPEPAQQTAPLVIPDAPPTPAPVVVTPATRTFGRVARSQAPETLPDGVVLVGALGPDLLLSAVQGGGPARVAGWRAEAPERALSPMLALRLQRAGASEPVAGRVWVIDAPGLDAAAVRSALALDGLQTSDAAFGFGRELAVTGTAEAWHRAVGRGWFRSAALPPDLQVNNLTSATWMRAVDVWPGGESGLEADGSGVVVGIVDGGTVDTRHVDYRGRAIALPAVEVEGRCGPNDTHGTHVAGTILGNGSSNPEARGIGWGARLLLSTSFCGRSVQDTVDLGLVADLSNHSYGSRAGWEWEGRWEWYGNAEFGRYNADARLMDEAILLQDHIWLAAAGNENGQGPENAPEDQPRDCSLGRDCLIAGSLAKNALIVAGVRQVDRGTTPLTVELMGMSSRGPADDGRIKPDLATRGEDVLSLLAGTGNGHIRLSGTSMASPGATGAATVLVGMYRDAHGGATPDAALIRALLIHGAQSPLGDGQPTPGLGHGLLDLRNSAEVLGQHIAGDGVHVVRGLERLRSSQTRLQFAAEAGESIVITVAWTDPPAEVPAPWEDATLPSLVHDLDIVVRNDGRTGTWFPWRFDLSSGEPVARRDGVNRVDNVERIVVPAAEVAAGNYEVVLERHGALLPGTSQVWWLVSSHPITAITPEQVPVIEVGRHAVVRLDDGSPTEVDAPIWAPEGLEGEWSIAGELPPWVSVSPLSGTTADLPPRVVVDVGALPEGGWHRAHWMVTASGRTLPQSVFVTTDTCPGITNPDQQDSDADGLGDVCDRCPTAFDPDQLDSDGDGRGDACDLCADVAETVDVDSDFDGAGDACDVCPDRADSAQADSDGDGIGDACGDRDGDGVVDGPIAPPQVLGWSDQYFDLLPDPSVLPDPNLAWSVEVIDRDDGGGPVFGNPAGITDGVVVHVSGTFRMPQDGTATFHLTSDDGSRLWINDAVVVDNDGLHAMVTVDGTATLPAGLHPFDIWMFERGGGAGLRLEWTDPRTGVRAVVPAATLSSADNCPDDANPGQSDRDGDGIGDACDPTDDSPVDPDAGPDPDAASDAGDDTSEPTPDVAPDTTAPDATDTTGAPDVVADATPTPDPTDDGQGGGSEAGCATTPSRAPALGWLGVIAAALMGRRPVRRRARVSPTAS